jgi:hypothetical protein
MGREIMNIDQLDILLTKNKVTWRSLENINYYKHFVYFNLLKPELDTPFGKKSHLEDNTKQYRWKTGGADIGRSYNFVIKKILNDFKKGVITI